MSDVVDPPRRCRPTSTRPHAPRNEDGFAIVNNTWVAILARPKLNSTRLDIDRMESKGQSVCREVAVCSHVSISTIAEPSSGA
jgi:hypothetical protein